MKTDKFETQIETLLDNITEKYYSWSSSSKYFDGEKVATFRNGMQIRPGRKWSKITTTSGIQERVWGFVANSNGVHKGLPFNEGDVFMAASWRAPAKHVRGSIYDTNTDWFSWTGPNGIR